MKTSNNIQSNENRNRVINYDFEIVRDFDTALERIDEEQAKGALDAWSGGTGADTSAVGLFEQRGSNN